MSDNPSQITINHVHIRNGEPKDSANLMGCYFEEVGQSNEWRLYSKLGDHIPTIPDNLTSGTNFEFIRVGMLWNVTEFKIGLGVARGDWANPRHERSGDDDGSFQAQSGVGAEEGSSAATA